MLRLYLYSSTQVYNCLDEPRLVYSVDYTENNGVFCLIRIILKNEKIDVLISAFASLFIVRI